MAIRVVVGEDSVVVREGIIRMLDRSQDIEVVATAADADTLRAAVTEHGPDVVLTDIRMPPTGTDEGIRIAGELRAQAPAIGVVVLSSARRADLRAGAVRRRVGRPRLPAQGPAARLAPSSPGRSARSPAAARSSTRWSSTRSSTARAQREGSPLRELTDREREILALIAQGLSNAAIADALVVTKRAVERHINAIFRKLGLRDARTSAAA